MERSGAPGEDGSLADISIRAISLQRANTAKYKPAKAKTTAVGYYLDHDKWDHAKKVHMFALINEDYDKILNKNPPDEELRAWEDDVEKQFETQTSAEFDASSHKPSKIVKTGFFKDMLQWDDQKTKNVNAYFQEQFIDFIETEPTEAEILAWKEKHTEQRVNRTSFASKLKDSNRNNVKSGEIDVESLWSVQPEIKN